MRDVNRNLRGRPADSRQFFFDESVAAALHALKELDSADVLDRWLTWPRVQSSARVLFEKHRQSSSSARSAVSKEIAVRHSAGDRPESEHRWFVEQLLARVSLDDLILRTQGRPEELVRELIGEAKRGEAVWPERVEETARDVFLTGVDSSQDLPVSRRDLLPLRVIRWRSSRYPIDPAFSRRALKARKSYYKLWDDLLVALKREVVVGDATTKSLVDAIGALEDGFLAQTLGAGQSVVDRVANAFAAAVIQLISGATTSTSVG